MPIRWDDYTPTKNKADVFRFLQGEGLGVEKTTFYNASLRPNKSGLYTKVVIENCLKREGWEFHGQDLNEYLDDMASRKLKAETLKLEAQAATEELKLAKARGEIIERAQVYKEFAARYTVYDAGWDFFIRSKVDTLIALAGGDQQNRQQVLDYLLDQKKVLGNQFCNMNEIEILFTGGE